MAQIVTALVAGLPSYVLVKVFQPAFFSREDTRTPVWIAAGALVINIGINFAVVPRFGIVGLAAATAFTSSLNVLTLYALLHRRGWYHATAKLGGRVLRQVVATAAMGAALVAIMPLMADRYAASALERAWSLGVLVGVGIRGVLWRWPSCSRRARPRHDRRSCDAGGGPRRSTSRSRGFVAAPNVLSAPAMDRSASSCVRRPAFRRVAGRPGDGRAALPSERRARAFRATSHFQF